MDAETYARIMDAAKLRAHALRREAIAQFWRDAGALVRRGWHSLVRPRAHAARRAAPGFTSLRSGAPSRPASSWPA